MIAEVKRRLELCGTDGLMVKVYYGIGDSAETLAKELKMSVEKVEKGIERALDYVSGKWPKKFESGRIKNYREFKWN